MSASIGPILIDTMSAREIKEKLSELVASIALYKKCSRFPDFENLQNIDFGDCFEKSDLIRKLKSHIEKATHEQVKFQYTSPWLNFNFTFFLQILRSKELANRAFQ